MPHCTTRQKGRARHDCTPPTAREDCDGASGAFDHYDLHNAVNMIAQRDHQVAISFTVPEHRQRQTIVPHINLHTCWVASGCVACESRSLTTGHA